MKTESSKFAGFLKVLAVCILLYQCLSVSCLATVLPVEQDIEPAFEIAEETVYPVYKSGTIVEFYFINDDFTDKNAKNRYKIVDLSTGKTVKYVSTTGSKGFYKVPSAVMEKTYKMVVTTNKRSGRTFDSAITYFHVNGVAIKPIGNTSKGVFHFSYKNRIGHSVGDTKLSISSKSIEKSRWKNIYKQIIDKINNGIDNSDPFEFKKEKYLAGHFSGAYLQGEKLVILLNRAGMNQLPTAEKFFKTFDIDIDATLLKDCIVRGAYYSLVELIEANDSLEELIIANLDWKKEMGILSISVDEKINRIVVEMNELSPAKITAIKKAVRVSGMLEFRDNL